MKLHCTRLALTVALLVPLAAWSQISVTIGLAPPLLPVYAQPPLPGDGYIWTPGYWAWNAPDGDYYWVPGTWVLAPVAGDLWTPGYWGFEGGGYLWHAGYWGRTVGYYGGLNYGYGYTGNGYQGGRWDQGHFRYNRAVSNLGHADAAIARAAYSARATAGARAGQLSYNGGPRGTSARPTPVQRRQSAEARQEPTREQAQHEQQALHAAPQRASTTHGRPDVAATPRPAAFSAPGVEHVRPQAERAQPRQQEPHPPQAQPQRQQEPHPQAQAQRQQEPHPRAQPAPRPQQGHPGEPDRDGNEQRPRP